MDDELEKISCFQAHYPYSIGEHRLGSGVHRLFTSDDRLTNDDKRFKGSKFLLRLEQGNGSQGKTSTNTTAKSGMMTSGWAGITMIGVFMM